ncbi:MAG: esterase [Lentimicrobium sp.]|nr:esterase [Lentimicrobium sp.]
MMNNIKNGTLQILLFALLLAVYQNLCAQQTAKLTEIEFQSKALNQNRPVYIYTPFEYDERDLVSFDVIYVFDAQNREIYDLVHSALNFIFLQKKFIVVGIASPAYEDSAYYRNSDYLPKPINVSLDSYQTDKPNAENFWKYVKDEIIPFIDKNYRTTHVNYLVGHSLSASFVLDKAITSHDLFKGFISISPNLAYDNNRLADDFLKIDFNQPAEKTFLYLSQSNEPETWSKAWGEAYYRVKNFVDNSDNSGKYDLIIREFPDYDHWSGFLPSITESLNLLYSFIDKNPYILKGNPEEITVKVSVPDKSDEVYITGNQESLGNWDPSAKKLNKISDFEREITLKVKFPIEFKFTKGSWETEGFTNQTTNNGENILINKHETNVVNLKIIGWAK